MKKPKTDEEVEKEFPTFINQLKWTLITDKIVQENNIQVKPDEIKKFCEATIVWIYGYAGALDEEQPWVKDYVEKMMKDRKYVEDAYNRIQSQKIFDWVETQLKPKEKEISAGRFHKNGGRASTSSSLSRS